MSGDDALDGRTQVVVWLTCPECGKRHLAAHGTNALGVVACPCGVRFSAFTGREVSG